MRCVPEVERGTARLVLIRLMGAPAARELMQRAWGVEGSQVTDGRGSETAEIDPDQLAQRRYARAQQTKQIVVRALGPPEPAAGGQACWRCWRG